MATKFEDAVAALKAQHFESPDMLQVLQLMVEQNERIKNLEHANLGTKHALGVLDDASRSNTTSIGSLAADRDAHSTRINEIASKPAADTKKIDDLATRVTAVEGAVGSKAWKRVDPPKPVVATGDPLVAPKPGFFSGLTGQPAPNPSAAPAGTP